MFCSSSGSGMTSWTSLRSSQRSWAALDCKAASAELNRVKDKLERLKMASQLCGLTPAEQKDMGRPGLLC
jgi:hypothetical protein